MISNLMSLLRPSRQEVLDALIKRACNWYGDVQAAERASCYYALLVHRCDPYSDWWTYAQLRQELADAQDEYERAYAQWERAKADVDALMESRE